MLPRLYLQLAGLACLLTAGCAGGAGGGPNAGPCGGTPPPPACSEPCTTTADCSAGLYCGTDGECTADCTFGGTECASDETCSFDGQCVDRGPEPDANACPSIAVYLEPIVPTVWFVVDRSGSMNEDFHGVSRWAAVRDALVDPTNGVVARLADKVVFGASLYTSNNGNAGGTCPILLESPPSIDNFTAIDTLLRSNQPLPEGDTPTSESIAAVAGAFPAADPDRPSPYIIVLATDGNPDNCASPDDWTTMSQTMSETAVAAAHTSNIETFVLSVGDDVSTTHLQRLADVGIGEAPGAGVGTPYIATDPDQLSAAFEDIIHGARACEFTLDKPVDVNRQCSGTVMLNGMTLECGTDWRITDSTTFELLGPACDAFLTEISIQLDAEFPCEVIIL